MNLLGMLQARISRINKEKGWYEDDRTFGDDIALCHSELSEALEAFRVRGFDYWRGEDEKPEGVAFELADVIIRILDMATRYNLDLTAAVLGKLDFNETRPYRHGGKRL